MKGSRLLIGLGVLGILLVVLFATSREPKTTEFHSPFHKLKIEDVTSLEVKRAADAEPTRLEKQGQGWRVTAPVQAPADTRNVQAALEKLRDLDIVDVASEARSAQATLEVDDAHAVHVVAKKGATVLLDVWVGAFKSNFTMVRRAGDDNVYRAAGSIKFAFDKALKDWRDRAIFDYEAEKFARVEFHSSNGDFSFNRGESDWIVDGPAIPEFDFHKVSSLVTTLARLRATDFAAANVTAEQAGLGDGAATVLFRLKEDQNDYVLRIGSSVTVGTQEQFYAQRQGNPTVFLISKYLANRLRPDAAKLRGTPHRDGGPAKGPVAPDGGVAARPTGDGGPQIPPEVMRQLQEQLRAQRRMSGSAENP